MVRTVSNTNSPTSLTASSIAWPAAAPNGGITTLTSANASNTNYSLVLPAASDTLAGIGGANTWTANQTFNGDVTIDGTLTLDGTGKAIGFPDSTTGALAFRVGYDLENKFLNSGITIHDSVNSTQWLFQSGKAAGNVCTKNNILDGGSGYMQAVSFASNSISPVDATGAIGGFASIDAQKFTATASSGGGVATIQPLAAQADNTTLTLPDATATLICDDGSGNIALTSGKLERQDDKSSSSGKLNASVIFSRVPRCKSYRNLHKPRN